MAKDKNKIRLPRPMGITAMVKQYHSMDPGDDKVAMGIRINNSIINAWFLSSGNLCGVPYSLHDLSQFLVVDPSYIQNWMMNQVIQSNLWDPQMNTQMVNSIMGQTIVWALEDRMEVQSQVDLLKRSQNGRYAPFISAEVNKALKMKLDTSTSLQSLVRLLTGGGSTTNNFFTQFNNNLPKEEASGITIQEALAIIQEEQGKLTEPKDSTLKYIENNYDVNEFPEVCALDQVGVDTEKEGLNLIGGELNIISGNYKGAIEVADGEFKAIEEEIIINTNKHITRRQLELGEDMDADDPECEVYD